VIKNYVKMLFKSVQQNTVQKLFSFLNEYIHTILSTVASLVLQIYTKKKNQVPPPEDDISYETELLSNCTKKSMDT